MFRVGFGAIVGILLVLAGTSMLLRQVFGIHLPLVRIFAGLLLVWMGLGLVASGFDRRLPGVPMSFAGGAMALDASGESNIVFSQGTVDLRGVTGPRVVKVNVIFGEGTVLVDPALPLRVSASSAFGRVDLPDTTAVVFGSGAWNTPAVASGEPAIELRVSAVFGSLHVVPSAVPTRAASAP